MAPLPLSHRPRAESGPEVDVNKQSKRSGPSCSTVHARVSDGLALVRAIASGMAGAHAIDTADATAFGNVGLVQAAQSFRESAGVPFEAWAAIRVRGAILDGLRSAGRLPRPTCRRGDPEVRAARAARHAAGMAAASEIGLVAAKGPEGRDERAPSPEHTLLVAERHRALRRALTQLPQVERAIIEKIYFADDSLTDASREVGLSKSWTSRIHAHALRRLYRELARMESPGVRLTARVARAA